MHGEGLVARDVTGVPSRPPEDTNPARDRLTIRGRNIMNDRTRTRTRRENRYVGWTRTWTRTSLFALVTVAVCGRPAPAQDMKPATLERCKKAALMVFTAISQNEKGDRPLGSGSGYFINSTGLAMTNNHVVDPTHMRSEEEKQRFHYGAGRLTWTVITAAGTEDEKAWEADVLYQNEQADQALLQVYDQDHNKLHSPDYLRFLPDVRLKERLSVYAFGFPGGDQQRTAKDKHPEVSVTNGHVLKVPRTPAGRIRMIYTDVIARPGNSGGAMTDQDGFLVGTVTLMTKPEERQESGGARYSALVPANLTRDILRNAFRLGKVPSGTDFVPLMEMMVDDDGRILISEFQRRPDEDVLYFENGDRFYGRINSDRIKWESEIGVLDVETAALAYVITDEDGAHLFLEGGNRVDGTEVGASFEFKPRGGEPLSYEYDDVKVVAFRTQDRTIKPPAGRTLTLDSRKAYLVLSEVKSAAKFESRLGILNIGFDEISRIERRPDEDEQVMVAADGRRLSGTFTQDMLEGTLAATSTTIRFNLAAVESAIVETTEYNPDNVRGLNLVGIMASAPRVIRRVAEALESKDVPRARASLKALMEPQEFRRRTELEKEQLRLLSGVAALRSGEYEPALRELRQSSRAEDLNVSAYAHACAEVLRRSGDYTYEGRPLSDRAAFVDAGQGLADELIRQVRDLIKDAQRLEGANRGEYVKGINNVKKHEKLMHVAAVLSGVDGDDELIRLWKFALDVARREVQRIDREAQEQQRGGAGGERRGSSARGGGAQLAMQRARDESQKMREEAIETYRTYLFKLYEYGFRIEDPDIQEYKEREAEDQPADPPGP